MIETECVLDHHGGKLVDQHLQPYLLLQAAHVYGNYPAFVVEANTRRILAASESAERLFGYSSGELRGRTTEFLHVDESSFLEFHNLSGNILSTGEAFRCHYRMKNRNGEEFNTEHFIHPITDEADQLQAVISFVRNRNEPGSLPLPIPEPMNFERLTEKMPGAVFQATRSAEGNYSYNYFRGNLLHRLGLTSRSPASDFQALIGRLSKEDRQRMFDCLERNAIALSVMDMELPVCADNGEQIWVRGISQPRKQENGAVVWDGLLFDITDQQRFRRELDYLHTHDYLTDLPNREFFDDRMNAILSEAREGGEKVLVGILNLVRFQSINQVYGFRQGDDVLRQVARRLQSVAADKDMIARFHGDEFLFFFRGLPNEEAALSRVREILGLFREPVKLDSQKQFPLEAKLGLALFPDHGDTAEDLRDGADLALRHVRATNDEPYAFYSRSMAEAVIFSMEMKNNLSRAINEGIIEPHYQPQYELASGQLSGLEVLARWPHGDGWVSPGRFIPIAEETGLIQALSTTLRNRLLADLHTYSHEGLNVPPVAINISAHIIRQPRFTEWVIEMFNGTGVAPENVVVEITETAFLYDYEKTFKVMTELSSMGILFSIDDFGTGFSSLSYLAQLPFHQLKVDRSFVARIDSDPRTRSVVHGIIDLSHKLGLRVVAEGVEKQSQLQILQEMNCDEVQGFLFARPQPLQCFHQELSQGRPHPLLL